MGENIYHFGNVANNGYYNRLILELNPESSEHFSSTIHAFSHPMWESQDFLPSDDFKIDRPDFREAKSPESSRGIVSEEPRDEYSGELEGRVHFGPSLVGRVVRQLTKLVPESTRNSKFINQLIGPWLEGLRRIVPIREDSRMGKSAVFFYGLDWPLDQFNHAAKRVLLEHGTLRWIENGLPRDSWRRRKFGEFVTKADFLLVTNLDPHTLRIANRLALNNWCALPHPYIVRDFQNLQVPWEIRESLLFRTRSQHLIFLPSSINMRADHDKGTAVALEAFVNLRRNGIDVGLVLVDWGRDQEIARKLLDESGMTQYATWLAPMPKVPLQRVMLACDLVWDQFGIEAFGALNLKASEVGVPLISRGITPEAVMLIGEEPKYLKAENASELEMQTLRVLTLATNSAPEGARRVFGEPQRQWLLRRHHHSLTATLEFNVLNYVDGIGERVTEDAWSRLPDFEPSGKDMDEFPGRLPYLSVTLL